MTGVISEEALRGQQSRIMKAMRAAQPQIGQTSLDTTQALLAQGRGGSYFDTINQLQGQRAQTNIDVETGIYNQMKEQAARGDSEAKAVDDAIAEVAGSDPKLYASILQDLHNDPENVDARNAKAKVMKYAAQRGIVPLSVQKEKADITNKLKGGDSPASVREWEYFKNLSPEDQKKYIGVKRTSADEVFEKERKKIQGKSQGEAEVDLPNTLSKAEQSIALLDDLINHPGLSTAVGAKGLTGGLLFGQVLPATDAADFMARLEQIQGTQFLEAYQSLKGGGQITEVEGAKAEKAIARMQRSQSEESFKQAANEFKEVIKNGMKRARQKAGASEEYVPPGKSINDVSDDDLKKILGL